MKAKLQGWKEKKASHLLPTEFRQNTNYFDIHSFNGKEFLADTNSGLSMKYLPRIIFSQTRAYVLLTRMEHNRLPFS